MGAGPARQRWARSMTATGIRPDAIAAGLGEPDQAWLRELLEELGAIERPSASAGEREAADWLVARFAELGAEARIEAERAHGTYWWPLGIGAARGALGGLAALRGRRGARRRARRRRRRGDRRRLPAGPPPAAKRCCPSATTHNVVCELGPADAERTVVIVAHHDAAHSGLVFHPAIPETIAERSAADRALDTSPPLMAPVIGGAGARGARRAHRQSRLLAEARGPARRRLGRGDGRHRRRARWFPGANDNGTAVVPLLALARAVARRADRRGPAGDPALDRLGGVLQRGDEGVRRAPLRRAAAREHLLPLRRHASARRT